MSLRHSPMRFLSYPATLASGIILGGLAGSFYAKLNFQTDVLSGAYSDCFGPARTEIQTAMAELKNGNANVTEHLEAADLWIKKSQEWTVRFLDGKGGVSR